MVYDKTKVLKYHATALSANPQEFGSAIPAPAGNGLYPADYQHPPVRGGGDSGVGGGD